MLAVIPISQGDAHNRYSPQTIAMFVVKIIYAFTVESYNVLQSYRLYNQDGGNKKEQRIGNYQENTLMEMSIQKWYTLNLTTHY